VLHIEGFSFSLGTTAARINPGYTRQKGLSKEMRVFQDNML